MYNYVVPLKQRKKYLNIISSLAEMYPGHVLASLDAETVIQDAQNLSECINLDAQIVILDVQNRSIGIQLDLELSRYSLYTCNSKLK